MAQSFLVLYLTQGRQLSPTTAGAVVAAVGVGDIGSQLLGGWLGDRIGQRHTMLAGFLSTAVALVALGSADSMPAICAAAVGVGLTADLFRPAGSAAVAELPAKERVRAYGLLFWAANLGFTVSTVAAGVLVRQGYGILFWINAAASVLAALIVWRHVPGTRPPTPKATRRALLPVLLRDPVMLAMVAISRPQRKRQFLLRGYAGLPACGARAARGGVPAGPLESGPGGFAPQEERAVLLAGVLDGVELGAWDRRVAGWLTELDTSTLVTVASWIARSRAAGQSR